MTHPFVTNRKGVTHRRSRYDVLAVVRRGGEIHYMDPLGLVESRKAMRRSHDVGPGLTLVAKTKASV
jgi:hypothetical protein